MSDILHSALDERFAAIMNVIAREYAADENLNGLTVDQHANARILAEQAIINWAVASKSTLSPRRPLTNLQHLLAEYCALAEYL